MSIWTFILNHLDLNIHATIKKITLINMLGSIPHQKFCFYHLPTRGRARIKLGDAWYVSNVSIIFYCSMLLYYLLWMFMGFIIHFYIIFGTNLLTGGPAQIAVFCLFQCFAEKEYQTESKRDETFGRDLFGTNANQKTWSGRQAIDEEATRQGGAPTPLGTPSTLVGPSWLPWRTSFTYIYPCTLKTFRWATKPLFHRRNLLYPWDPILGPVPELRQKGHRSRRASTSTP